MNQLNYFALFLDNENYIIQCLSLIRYVCKPNSRLLPHITLRVAQESLMNDQIDKYFNTFNVKYLDLIKPGVFNFESNSQPLIVYMLCGSSDLEVAQYKPDFPFSKLHITLYEGDDKEFAKNLLALLNKEEWGIRIKFKAPQQLKKNTVGQSLPDQSYSFVLPILYISEHSTISSLEYSCL